MMHSASLYSSKFIRENKENMPQRMNRSTKDSYFSCKNSNNISLNFNNMSAWSMSKGKGKENRRNNQELVSTIEEMQHDENYGQEMSRVTGDGMRSVMDNCLISKNNNYSHYSNNYNSKSNYSNINTQVHQKQKRLKILTQSDLTDDNDYNDLQQQLFSQHTVQQQSIVQQQYNIYEQNVNQIHHRCKENNNRKTINPHKAIKSYQKNQSRKQPKGSQVESVLKQEISLTNQSPHLFILIPNYKLQIKNYHHIKQINLSILINLIQPRQQLSIKTLTKLTINNCLLNSLQGIQSFQQLEQINLRKNQLRQVQELYKISKKQKIITINIQGNDIEYYHMATYKNLKKIFINLKQLNDKNYGLMERKNKKDQDMRSLLKRSIKIECQMKNQLKKEIKKTDRAMIRYNPSGFSKNKQQQQMIEEQEQEFEQNFKKTMKNNINQNQKHQFSSKSNKKIKCVEDDQQMGNIYLSDCHDGHYSLGQQQQDGQSFKNIPSLQMAKQLSLGSIQNVPLTRSVNVIKPLQLRGNSYRFSNNNNNKGVITMMDNKCEQNNRQNSHYDRDIINSNPTNSKINQIPLQTTIPFQTKGLLQIKTQNLDDDDDKEQLHNNSHLHQPTATFAMQLQKQQQYALQNKQFMFRNNANRRQQPNIMEKTARVKSTNNMGNKSLVLMIENDNQYSQQENGEIMQQDELMVLSYGGNNQSMSLSQISEIPTKRMSREKSITSNNRKSLRQQQQYNNKGNINTNGGDYVQQEQQSFITASANDYLMGNNNHNNNTLINYNNSYLAYSQFTQYKPNQSMDEDCLLKQNKNTLEQEKLAIATAIYMRNLITKSLYALALQSGKRKNLPKKKQHARKFVN